MLVAPSELNKPLGIFVDTDREYLPFSTIFSGWKDQDSACYK